MIIPQYWSESKTKKRIDGRQFTVKRFGWSDISEQDAKKHADERLQEAINTLETERTVRRIDHKTSYNGAEGIPIREEVVSRHEDVIISRNAYGALCLNTPDVLFADIDLEYKAPLQIRVTSFIVLFLISAVAGWYWKSWSALFVSMFIAATFAPTLANLVYKLVLSISGGLEQKTLKKIKKASKDHPDWHLRVYKTPLGFRVLLMNDTYCPTDDTTISILNALKSDPIYVQMCKNQHCFRARVSPKPWRIGLERLKPRPGVWPIKQERMAERREWVALYEKKAENYSSCQYLMHLGSDKVAAKAERVRQMHDELCKANRSELTIA